MNLLRFIRYCLALPVVRISRGIRRERVEGEANGYRERDETIKEPTRGALDWNGESKRKRNYKKEIRKGIKKKKRKIRRIVAARTPSHAREKCKRERDGCGEPGK